MRRIFRAYLNRDSGYLKRVIPNDLVGYFSLHWSGKYLAAANTSVCIEVLPDGVAALYAADVSLLQMKLGLPYNADDFAIINRWAGAKAIHEYAKFSRYFWIDHNRAFSAIGRIIALGIAYPGSGIACMGLFLLGHLLVIKGHRFVGFRLAALIYCYFSSMNRFGRSIPVFSSNIVVSSFPYTCFLSKNVKWLKSSALASQAAHVKESYYKVISIASQLYAFSYSGDIIRSEIIAHRMEELLKNGELTRYRTLSRLLILVPVALRGYAAGIVDDFESVVGDHEDKFFDPLINAQFYRAAAIICLTLSDFERGAAFINKATIFRNETKSFHAWGKFDEKISELCENKIFDFDVLYVFAQKKQARPDFNYGKFLLELANLLSRVDDVGFDFVNECASLISNHLTCNKYSVSGTVPSSESRRKCVVKIGPRFVSFDSINPEKDMVFLEMCIPMVKVFGEVAKKAKRQKQYDRYKAIAQTTQMIAHDVRRPFSQMQGLLMLVKREDDPEKVKDIVAKYGDHIGGAIRSVDDMLSDVMEIGNDDSIKVEQAEVCDLILRSLSDVFAAHEEYDVALSYKFSHFHTLLVSKEKVQRVLTNIIANAAEAGASAIAFSTSERKIGESQWLEICIRNNNSSIPSANVKKIFDAFFTEGKPGGSGLGLAVATKIIEAHGGTISCKPYEGREVEFVFALPAGDGSDEGQANLPTHSRLLNYGSE